MKKRAFKIYKAFIDTFTAAVLVLCLWSVCALDSDSWTPTIIFVASLGWLTLYAWTHGWLGECGEEE